MKRMATLRRTSCFASRHFPESDRPGIIAACAGENGRIRAMTDKLSIEPLTPDRWRDLVDLFSRPGLVRRARLLLHVLPPLRRAGGSGGRHPLGSEQASAKGLGRPRDRAGPAGLSETARGRLGVAWAAGALRQARALAGHEAGRRRNRSGRSSASSSIRRKGAPALRRPCSRARSPGRARIA